MAPFAMCDDCRREYDDPRDRRFHAQPNACPACGPRARRLSTAAGRRDPDDDPIAARPRRSADGLIVAIKGLGGFHLACDATSSMAVARLRERKRREEKPFAVMVRDLAAAEAIADLGRTERALLALRRAADRSRRAARRTRDLAAKSRRDNPLVGLCSRTRRCTTCCSPTPARPLVMTSGNLSDEPIASETPRRSRGSAGSPTLFLLHDREIEIARATTPSSRVIAGSARWCCAASRGYVPRAVAIAGAFRRAGARLRRAPEEHLLHRPRRRGVPRAAHRRPREPRDASQSFERGRRAHGAVPRVSARAHRPRPASRLSLDRLRARRPNGVETVGVQHHHAHVAQRDGRARPRRAGARRRVRRHRVRHRRHGVGRRVPARDLRGLRAPRDFPRRRRSRAAIRRSDEVWRIALALLDDAFDGRAAARADSRFSRAVEPRDLDSCARMISAPDLTRRWRAASAATSTPSARSAWRAGNALRGPGRASPGTSPPIRRSAAPIRSPSMHEGARRGRSICGRRVRAAVDDLFAGASPAAISARFHDTLAEATGRGRARGAERRATCRSSLTGGCFQNARLAERIVERFAPESRVHLHRRGSAGRRRPRARPGGRRRGRARRQAADRDHSRLEVPVCV